MSNSNPCATVAFPIQKLKSRIKCVAPARPPSGLKNNALVYGCVPPSQNWAEAPSSEGLFTPCVSEWAVLIPVPPGPAHALQDCQPDISSMLETTLPAVDGAVVLLVTAMDRTCWKYFPLVSHAFMMTECDPAA